MGGDHGLHDVYCLFFIDVFHLVSLSEREANKADMKLIVTGLEDSGKGLKLAEIFENLVYRNARYIQMGLKPRPIVSVLPLTPRALQWAHDLGVPIVDWSASTTVIADLETLTSCDLILDEVGTYFDARTFKDLPLSTRLWLAQASKLGVDIYGAAQDFSQVDISFRRLTNHLIEITKIIGSARPDPNGTRPIPKRIWGLCMERELSAIGYDEKNKYAGAKGMPKFWLIQEKYCQIYFTNKRVPKGELPPYKHHVRRCEQPGCQFELYTKVQGVKHKIAHV